MLPPVDFEPELHPKLGTRFAVGAVIAKYIVFLFRNIMIWVCRSMKLKHTDCVLCRIHVPPSKSISVNWVLGVYGYAGNCSYSVRGFMYPSARLQANVPLLATIHPGGWGYYRFTIATDLGFMMWVNATSLSGHLSVFLKKGILMALVSPPARVAGKTSSSLCLPQARTLNTKKTSRELQLEPPIP